METFCSKEHWPPGGAGSCCSRRNWSRVGCGGGNHNLTVGGGEGMGGGKLVWSQAVTALPWEARPALPRVGRSQLSSGMPLASGPGSEFSAGGGEGLPPGGRRRGHPLPGASGQRL